MSITREQLWKRMEELHTDLYHTGKNYCSSIVGGKKKMVIMMIVIIVLKI